MCFWKRKKKPEAFPVPAEEKSSRELVFDGPFFTVDMVPVVPASLDDMKPDVKPEDFAVYTNGDKR